MAKPRSGGGLGMSKVVHRQAPKAEPKPHAINPSSSHLSKSPAAIPPAKPAKTQMMTLTTSGIASPPLPARAEACFGGLKPSSEARPFREWSEIATAIVEHDKRQEAPKARTDGARKESGDGTDART
jgi:hypothetical protein